MNTTALSLDPVTPAFAHFQTPEEELTAQLEKRHPPADRQPIPLSPLVEEQIRRGETWRESLLHHPGGDLIERQARLRAILRQAVEIPGARVGTPGSQLLSRREEADYTVEELLIEVTPPLKAPATVVIPHNGQTRHPALLLLHSMGGNRVYGREKLLAFEGEPSWLSDYRQTYYEGRSLQVELARAGYLSIAIDAINFGERCAKAQSDPLHFKEWRGRANTEEALDLTIAISSTAESDSSRQLLSIGLSTAALVVTDDLRTLDYLASRHDVDEGRIGAAGLSFGSFRTNYLAALDDRVKTAVSVCWISTHLGVLRHNLLGSLGFFAMPPGLYRKLDLADLPALAAPKPFLAISGWRDPMIEPFGMAEAHLFLRRIWAAHDAGEKLGSLIYDAPHTFNATMQEAAIAFLDRHL